MKEIIQKSRYLVLAAVLPLLVMTVVAYIWGILKSYYAIVEVIDTAGKSDHIAVSLIGIMDAYLIAVGLFILAVNLYELFIGRLDMPSWLLACNLHELKSKISSMIILVMAVKFLEHLVEWVNPLETFYLGVAVALVSAVLIVYERWGEHD